MSKQKTVLILSDRIYSKFLNFAEDYLGITPLSSNKIKDCSYYIKDKNVRFINLVISKYWSMGEIERELFKHKEINAIILYVMRDASVVGTWLNFLDCYFDKQTLQKVALGIFTQQNWGSREQVLQKLMNGVTYEKFYFNYEAAALFNGRDKIKERYEWSNSGESWRKLLDYILDGDAANIIQLTPLGLALKITKRMYDLLEEILFVIEENLVMLENFIYVYNEYIGCNESKYLKVPLISFMENSMFEILDVPGVEVKKIFTCKRNELLTIPQCSKMVEDLKYEKQVILETLVAFLLFKKKNFNRTRDHFLNIIDIKTSESQSNKNICETIRKQYLTILAIEELNVQNTNVQEFTPEHVIKCVERLKKLQHTGPVITEVYYERIAKELSEIPCVALALDSAVDPEIQELEMIKSMGSLIADFSKEIVDLRTVCKMNENYSKLIVSDLKIIKNNQSDIKEMLCELTKLK